MIIKEEEVILYNIIKHPLNEPLAVIKKPILYVRESYKDLYHIIISKASEPHDCCSSHILCESVLLANDFEIEVPDQERNCDSKFLIINMSH